ncbi:hypothetical protein Dimus_001912 [Dionaea muscipula]
MNPANKLFKHHILRWVSSHQPLNPLKTQSNQNPRFYARQVVVSVSAQDQNFGGTSTSNGDNAVKISVAVVREAQAALLDYLHSTRSLQFLDAECMSKKSPNFLKKLLEKVGNDPRTTRSSLTRFFRYHPINEFEPFFESMGLDASDFIPLLPRDLMFLSDGANLLDNYHVLCNYGIPRDKIGKVYKEAREVFEYDYGVLQSKLRAYERLGLGESAVIKVVSCSPDLLVGDVNEEFSQVWGKLKFLGFENNCLEEHLVEENSYNWRRILELLYVLSDLGGNEAELASVLRRHPELLFDGSASVTFSIIGFLLKFGSMKNDVYSMFLQLPQLKVRNVLGNLRKGFNFLVQIGMDAEEIAKIIRSHAALLGSCRLMKTNTVLQYLGIGKKRLCDIIIEEPRELKNWVLGAKVKKLPPGNRQEERSREDKIKFLSNIGFTENSPQMSKALKDFRGTGLEIQQRFDCLVKAGLDQKDVKRMIKVSPQILNSTVEVLQEKIDYLVNCLGYPVTKLVSFPAFLSYTKSRIWLRHSMYKWLVEQRAARPGLSLSTIIACTDKVFVKTYVNRHRKGLAVWEELKDTVSSIPNL